MNNPYAQAQLVLRNGDPLEELRLHGGERSLSTSTGEINAYNKVDLIRNLDGLMKAVASGQIVPQHMSASANSQEAARIKEERRVAIASAYNDSTGAKWAALGASLAGRIEEVRARDGFLRRLAVGTTLKQSEVHRVPMPTHEAVAVVATSASDVDYQLVRNKVFTPDEFEINANLRCEALDIEQVSGDLLDDMFNQGIEQIMVQEDRLWKYAADKTVGSFNPINYIGGQLTPHTLAVIRSGVTDWGLPATTALISNDVWNDVIGNPDFHQFLDPVSKYDLAFNGFLGTLVGLNMITDGFRQKNQKVLERGEIYVVSDPVNHAAYSDRGGVRSTPTNGADQGNSTKGWFMTELFSFVLANGKSVSKGIRI